MNIEFKKDSRIQGLLKIKKASFAKCKAIDCMYLDKCTKQRARDVQCVFKKPLVEFTDSKTFLEPGGFTKAQKVKNYFKRLLAGKKYKNVFHNDTNQTFLNDLAKHVAGESQPDLEAQFVAVSTQFGTPDKNSVLQNEIGRVAPSSNNRSNAQVVIEATFGLTDANTITSTVASAVSTSDFNVNSAVLTLQAGDTIQVILSGLGNRPEEREIDTVSVVSGSISRITTVTPFSSIPVATDTFKQLINRIHIVHGGGTSTLNSGSPLSITTYSTDKASTDTLDITYEITFV